LDRASGILTAFTGNSTTGVIRLQLVVELPGSNPVVNDAVEEIFVLPSGVNRIND
jgi:molybdopterin biosynthesis enzyme MoaB